MAITARLLFPALGITALSCAPSRQPDTRSLQAVGRQASLLVGTWLIRVIEVTDAAGRVDSSHPVGMIVYTPEGRMTVQIMATPRPVVPPVPEGPDEVNAWSPEEARRVLETYDAYFGTYEVDEAKHIVTHHVEGELRPNYVGAAFTRRFEVDGDRLVLGSTNPGEHWRVVWQRVR